MERNGASPFKFHRLRAIVRMMMIRPKVQYLLLPWMERLLWPGQIKVKFFSTGRSMVVDCGLTNDIAIVTTARRMGYENSRVMIVATVCLY